MAHLNTDQCRQLARARREAGLTQSALAREVGCAQSAISMLESGQPEKLARETVGRIAERLGVALEPAADPAAEPGAPPPPAAGAPAAGWCPQPECTSNVPAVVRGELLFWPRPQPLARGPRCAHCGELLETACPACGAPAAAAGACCAACGAPRVTNTLPPGTDPAAWAAARRRELNEWRALL